MLGPPLETLPYTTPSESIPFTWTTVIPAGTGRVANPPAAVHRHPTLVPGTLVVAVPATTPQSLMALAPADTVPGGRPMPFMPDAAVQMKTSEVAAVEVCDVPAT